MTCAHMFRTAVQRHFATIEGQRFIVFILIFIVFFNIFIYFVNLLLFVFIKYFHSFCIEKFVVSIHIAVFVCVCLYVCGYVRLSAIQNTCTAPPTIRSLSTMLCAVLGRAPRTVRTSTHTAAPPKARVRQSEATAADRRPSAWMDVCVCVFVCLDAYLCVRVWMALTVPDESLSLCLSAGVGL